MTEKPSPAKLPEFKVLAAKVPLRIHKRFRQLAANKDTTLQDLIVEALRQYLEAQ